MASEPSGYWLRCDELGAYLVTESVPLFPSLVRSVLVHGSGQHRAPAPARGLDQATWLTRWQRDRTQEWLSRHRRPAVTQNWVVRTLTPRGTGNRGHCRRVVSRGGDSRSENFFGAAALTTICGVG